jgi:hypothetical protein
MKRSHERVEEERRVLELGQVILAIAWFGPPLWIWGWQILTWLRHGWWPRFTVADLLSKLGVPLPYTEWAGVQTVLDFLLRWPAAVGILFAGWIVGTVYTDFMDRRVGYRSLLND